MLNSRGCILASAEEERLGGLRVPRVGIGQVFEIPHRGEVYLGHLSKEFVDIEGLAIRLPYGVFGPHGLNRPERLACNGPRFGQLGETSRDRVKSTLSLREIALPILLVVQVGKNDDQKGSGYVHVLASDISILAVICLSIHETTDLRVRDRRVLHTVRGVVELHEVRGVQRRLKAGHSLDGIEALSLEEGTIEEDDNGVVKSECGPEAINLASITPTRRRQLT